MSIEWYHLASTGIIVILGLGLLLRRQQKTHITLMSLAFILDVILVLIIEFNLQAVEKVVSNSVSPLTMFHALISLGVIALYIAQIYWGRKISTGHLQARQFHNTFAQWFILLRLTNYATSFFVG